MKNDECELKITPEWVTAIIAGIALIFAGAQIYYSNHSQKNNTAIETYREYIKLALDNSKYSYGYQYFDNFETLVGESLVVNNCLNDQVQLADHSVVLQRHSMLKAHS